MVPTKNIGHEFPVQNAEVIEAKRRYLETQTTAWIAKAILAVALMSLVGAGLHGVMSENFSALQTLWAVTALPLGAVMKHYFERRARHEQKND